MSGTGKSSVIADLAARGYKAVDAGDNGLSHMVSVPEDELTGLDPGQDWVWNENLIQTLLSAGDTSVLFLGGCAPNQGKFYPQFDEVVLLCAPADAIVARLTERSNNHYGKHPGEIERTLALKQTIEPLLRQGASHEIDTRIPLDRVVAWVLQIVGLST